MTTTDQLGLPLEYQQMPEYFDAHNVSAETDAKNAVIEQLLNNQGVRTIFDMTCGTGSQAFYLTERGYKVTGSDFSPALIEKARSKAQDLGKNIHFLHGDMRDIQVGSFDAVITIFNAIGHLDKKDFAKALKNISSNLKKDGIYVFDIFNLQAITDEVLKSFVMDIKSTVGSAQIRNQQHSEIDKEKGLLISHDHYTITKENNAPEIHTNTFSLQMYTASELEQLLSENGFEIVAQCDMEGYPFNADKSVTMVTVAKKSANERLSK